MGGGVAVSTQQYSKPGKIIMTIQKENNLNSLLLKKSRQEFLGMLFDHEVQALIFESDSDNQWIDFFRNQPNWKVVFDDDQIVSFELDNCI